VIVTAEASHRKLAAIMFTDMVGYSALAQRDDELALELLEEHRRLLREIFPRFCGSEIKTIGDGFLVEFQSALDAAQCAIEIQRALSRRNAAVPAERRIEIKIGIHIGDVVHRNGDVYGDGVNIASRIEPLAGPGGICVSMDVERQIRNTLEARFEKLAPTELKNISIPMDLFRIVPAGEKQTSVEAQSETESTRASRKFLWTAVALVFVLMIGIGWWWSERPRRTPVSPVATTASSAAEQIPPKSIAVLPFENLSRDPDNAYFVEGIQDEILTRLSKIAELKVISHTSTQKYKSAPDNLRDVARQLGVANILEGSVQRSNDRVRVNVQLINALSDAHLWADTYDRQLTDIFAVESEIAKTIAETLQAKLTGSEKTAILKRPTENPEAHELYLKGRFFWNKRTAADLRRSIDYFNEAIKKDPNYAPAYAALAQSWKLLPAFNGGAPTDCFPQAEAAARKALELDATSSTARAALASLKGLNGFDYPGAIAEYKQTLELNPNDATTLQWFANDALANVGQSDRELEELKRAVELDPLSLIINSNLGVAYIHSGRLDHAVTQLRKTIELDGSFYYAHYNLALALELKGAIPEAMGEYQKTISLSDDAVPLGMLGRLYAVQGRKEEAQKILQQLLDRRKQAYIPAYSVALVYLGLGDRNEALNWLETGYREHDGFNIGPIRIDPLLASLHGDPRFEALADKIVPAAEFKGVAASK
jgi:TolB-like protein/class 3 adenylate cyclase/Flp pilus assembly protein TadD